MRLNFAPPALALAAHATMADDSAAQQYGVAFPFSPAPPQLFLMRAVPYMHRCIKQTLYITGL